MIKLRKLFSTLNALSPGRITALSFLALSLVLLILKFNTLNTAFHWDAMKYVVPSSEGIYDRWNDVAAAVFSGHPPLFYFLLASFWHVCGKTLIASHLFNLAWGAVALTGLGLLTRRLYGAAAAGWAVALLLFNQIFFAQVGTVQLEVALMGVGIWAVYFYIQGKRGLLILALLIMLLIKETSAVLYAVILLFDVVSGIRRKDPWGKILKHAGLLLLPILPFAAWIVLHGSAVGWIVRTRDVLHLADFVPSFFRNLLKYLIFDFSLENVNRSTWILLVPIAVFLVAQAKARKLKYEILFLTIILSYFVLFSFIRDKALPRYFLAIIPFVILLGAAAAVRLGAGSRRLNVVVSLGLGAVIALSVANYGGQRNTDGWRLESNMEYLDMVRLHQEACRIIERDFPEHAIVTSFPFTRALMNPWFGYVSRRQRLIPFDKFDGEATVLVVWSAQANFVDIREFISSHKAQLKEVRSLSFRGKAVKIFEKRTAEDPD